MATRLEATSSAPPEECDVTGWGAYGGMGRGRTVVDIGHPGSPGLVRRGSLRSVPVAVS